MAESSFGDTQFGVSVQKIFLTVERPGWSKVVLFKFMAVFVISVKGRSTEGSMEVKEMFCRRSLLGVVCTIAIVNRVLLCSSVLDMSFRFLDNASATMLDFPLMGIIWNSNSTSSSRHPTCHGDKCPCV